MWKIRTENVSCFTVDIFDWSFLFGYTLYVLLLPFRCLCCKLLGSTPGNRNVSCHCFDWQKWFFRKGEYFFTYLKYFHSEKSFFLVHRRTTSQTCNNWWAHVMVQLWDGEKRIWRPKTLWIYGVQVDFRTPCSQKLEDSDI